MKRIMTCCLLITMALDGVLAQKGMQQVGVDLGVCTDTRIIVYKLVGGGFKYRYHFTDNICIEPDIQFYFEPTSDTDFYYHYGSEEGQWLKYTQFIGSANLLYFFGHPKIWRPYAGTGFALGTLHVDNPRRYSNYPWNYSEIGFQFICGIDKRLSYNFSLQIEAKLFYGGLAEGNTDSEFIPILANLGLTYNF